MNFLVTCKDLSTVSQPEGKGWFHWYKPPIFPFQSLLNLILFNNSLLCQCGVLSSLTVLYMRSMTRFLGWYRIFLALVPLRVTAPKSGISLPLVHLSTLNFLSNLCKHVLSLFVFFYFTMLSHQPCVSLT